MELIRIPDFRNEALLILQRMSKSETDFDDGSYIFGDFNGDLAYFKQKYALNGDETDKLFGEAADIYNLAAKQMGNRIDEIKRYFSRLYPLFISVGLLVFELERIDSKRMSENGRDRILSGAIVSAVTDEIGALQDVPDDAESLLQFLSDSDLSDEARWQLTDFYIGYDRVRERVGALIDETADCLRKQAHRLMPLIERCIKRLETKGSLLDSKEIQIGKGQDAVVQPVIYSYSSISFRMEDVVGAIFGTESGKMQIQYGFLCDWIHEFKKERYGSEETILRTLRALDDKTRIGILKALKQKPLFGNEIAKLTGLSPATVSHHMNELFGKNLIAIEKQGASFLYSLRTDTLTRFLEDFRQMLL